MLTLQAMYSIIYFLLDYRYNIDVFSHPPEPYSLAVVGKFVLFVCMLCLRLWCGRLLYCPYHVGLGFRLPELEIVMIVECSDVLH